MGIPRVYTYSDGWIDDKIDVASGFAEPLKEYCFTVHNIGYPSSSISMHYSALKNWILFRLINESALKFNESALKNLLLNLTNLPLKI